MYLKKNLIAIFILINIFNIVLHRIVCVSFTNINLKYQHGSIKCIDKGLYKTCLYRNIYYVKNKFIIFIDNNITFNCVNIYAQNLKYCWKPIVHSINQFNQYNIHISKIYNDISIPFILTYYKNYGHALWDDLYSIYTSLVKLGYYNESFNLIVPQNNTYRNPEFLKDIYNSFEKFARRRIIFLDSIKNITLLFTKLVVGSSHQCQRCVTLDYSLKYSREYNITKLVRDRMYEVFRIKPSYSLPIKGIIVHNKRYNRYEIDVLKNITNYYKNSSILNLYYINFMNISGFYNQLKLLSRIHLYISGPGTGLLNFPFISDPGVVIHLGHIHFGCPQYLEQYILEGSPHFKAFYYSPKRRMKRMNYSYILEIIDKATKYVLNKQSIYIEKEENLNQIGKLYVKICKENKYICEKLIDNFDWGYGKCRGIWAENVVFFPSLYKKIPLLKRIVISYNSTYDLGCSIGINYSSQKQCK